MLMKIPFSQDPIFCIFGMLQNLKYRLGLSKAPMLYTGYVRTVDGQPHGYGVKSSSHHPRTRLLTLHEAGEFRDGKLNGPAFRAVFVIGIWHRTILGQFVDDVERKCRIMYREGNVIDGELEELTVIGKVFTPDGNVREGSFKVYNFEFIDDKGKVYADTPAKIFKKEVTLDPTLPLCSFSATSQ